ncbi:hypothetical protein GQ543_06060 [candidate division WOR-3 bacterium]|nr:hypothetical protein [candidate division WOR-3 bacterium]
MNITKTINYLEYRKEAYYTWLYDLAWTKRLLLALQGHSFQALNKILTWVQLSIR